MSGPSFRVYIDESGEEGFVFRPDGSGSSRWLILSAVVTRRENDLQVVRLMERVRQTLGRAPRQALHFYKLNHAQRVVWAREIAQTPLRTVSVLIHKPSIRETERFQSQKHLLYRYASRYLLERVSWLCRDHHKPDTGNGQAEVIFSNRSQMSYDELRGYLSKLKEETGDFGVTIDWSVLNPEAIRAVEHSQLAGLQVADAVASSLFAALNPNPYGDTEDKYARLLLPSCYRHKGAMLGYGLKFWPGDFETLKKENPRLLTFAEGLK
jgi:hypothetical protein